MSDDIENHRITIAPTRSRQHAHPTVGDTTLTVRRTLSIRAPTVPPSARLPIEFRTLSLHLEQSRTSPTNNNGKAPKATVKGWSD